MKIVFLDNYTVKAENGPKYLAGTIYDLPDDSAQHFLSRGLAAIPDEIVPEEAEKSEEIETADEPVKKMKRSLR